MPIRVIDGDLFSTTADYICHQVNCKGKMGSGVAKQVREKYPEVYEAYIERCRGGHNHVDPFWTFGESQLVKCHDGKTIINMFAQSGYGYDGKLYTDYAAFRSCLQRIKETVPFSATIAMPFKIGCGLGGGDWDKVLNLIKAELGASYDVELWRWNGVR